MGLTGNRMIMSPGEHTQSVIANWMNEKKIPLEQAQIEAGQKWISTTQKYRQANMDEEREMMHKWLSI